MTDQSIVLKYQEQVKHELATPEVVASLIETRFKGLTEQLIRKAMVEGLIRGFSIKDFFAGNVYAIPFKSKGYNNEIILGYSLVTSLDNSRKIGAKSGIVGVDEPIFAEEGNQLFCRITVHKQFETGYIGDFTAKVFLTEYVKLYDGKPTGLWATKPRTMLAKVAEMHALRKACPELAESYIAEEVERPVIEQKPTVTEAAIDEWKGKMAACQSLKELEALWPTIPPEVRNNSEVDTLKADLKAQFDS